MNKTSTYFALFFFMLLIVCLILSIVGILFLLLFRGLFLEIGQTLINKLDGNETNS